MIRIARHARRAGRCVDYLTLTKYFAPVLEEVLTMKNDPDYWAYLRYRLTRMENEWKRYHSEAVSPNREEEMGAGIELP